MTVQEANKAIMDVIAESTETEVALTEQTELVQELGLSSMEVVVLLGDLEDVFGITIPVSRIRSVRTVGDLCRVIIAILTE